MEEWIGQLWHRAVTRAARTDFPDAAVTLDDMRKPVAVMFRALGGTRGLGVDAARETASAARRSLLSRIAGTGSRVELAWRDAETLRLPARIAWFPEAALNRDLYLWLAALAAHPSPPGGDWLQANALASARLLRVYPGLARRYRRLVEAHLRQRPAPERLADDEAAQERLIRRCLRDPDAAAAVGPLLAAHRPAQPVPLWLHPDPPGIPAASAVADDEPGDERTPGETLETDKRRAGERVDSPDGRSGLLAFRLESLFTRAEYAAVDRTTEENEDKDTKSAVEDLDVLSLARDRKRTAARLRFDLDLPPEDNDDLCLGEGIALPEWDYRRQCLVPDYCRLQPMLARAPDPAPLPDRLRVKARRLRAQFETLRPSRVWLNAQPDGAELDFQALIEHAADRALGVRDADADLFRRSERRARDLACLLLADLSLSTDSYVNDEQRVIDVIRESLLMFSEALAATGDRFALYGFSSRRRSHVRFHTLKTFEETYAPAVRARIQAIRPGYYTRMGAAVRHASQLLATRRAEKKLLLILTDGKPNDLDRYEGRYGIEDTRHAVREVAALGMTPFCVTIDDKAGDYLPYLFGVNSYLHVKNAADLPARLPLLYARLTQG
jgi:nitric oxide reductase NorD protein